jgi:hypothetical protein
MAIASASMPQWLNSLLIRGARGQPVIWVPIFGIACFVLAWGAGQRWSAALVEGLLTAFVAALILLVGRRIDDARARD